MKFNGPIYEERITAVHQVSQMDISSLRNYIKYCKSSAFPEMESKGGKVVCLLQGLIGTPNNVFLQITQYPDIKKYYNIQSEIIRNNIEMIESEQVKLFMAITPRPKDPFPLTDQRPIYSNRVFFIKKKDIDLYANLSDQKVWPLYEAWGVSVLGLFSSLSYEILHEIKLFAGYNSIAHWEETRNLTGSKPENIEKEVWEEGKNAVFKRAELTIKSNVSLMRTVYFPNNK
ncbi:MAG: hypothetical protein ACFFAI_13595 [Promethearchaeota archaeon]